MATFIVTTLADEDDASPTVFSPGGSGLSLREAIALANANSGADTIIFDSSLNGIIRLDGGDGVGGVAGGTLAVTELLTIDGDGRITISGDIAGDDTLVAGTAITNVAASLAAGTLTDNVRLMSSSAALTVEGLTLTGGNDSGNGGAISADGQFVTLTDATIAGNRAGNSGGGISAGGALVSGSTLAGNVAVGSGGAIFAAGQLTIFDSTLSGNRSGSGGGAAFSSGVMTVSNTTVSGNTASSQAGGGLNASTALVMSNSTVTGNAAGMGSGFSAGNAGPGTSITNSVVSGNAVGFGGEFYTQFGHTLIGGNVIGTDVYSGSTDVGDTTTAAVFAQTVDIGGGILAGVLGNNGGPVQTVALNASIANPALDASNGSATTSDARGVAATDIPGVGTGASVRDLGAFEVNTQEARSLVVTTLADVVDAFDGVTSLREAIAFANSGDADGVNGTTDTITFASNLNGTIRLGGGDGVGGVAGGTLAVTEALIIDGDGRITISGDIAGDDTLVAGTAVTNVAASLTAGTLTDNVRLMEATANLTLEGLVLTGGNATGHGGAVYAQSSDVGLVDTTVAGNRATTNGGGVNAAYTSVTGSTIRDNVAGNNGGGLYSGRLDMANVTVSGNTATAQLGGGFYVFTVLVATNITVTGNTAGFSAGGFVIGNVGNASTLTNSIVMGNKAGSSADVQAPFGYTRSGGNIIGTDVYSGSTDVGDTTAADVFAQTVDIGGGIRAGVLGNNGGPVQTVALNASLTNPALDAATTAAPTTDARGLARHDNPLVANGNGGTGADLGAYEVQNSPPTFDPTPRSAGNDIPVNTYTTDFQVAPSVAALADGGFVVTWWSYQQEGTGWSIYAQRYDATGTASGSPFRVNDSTTSSHQEAAATALPDGGFIIVWTNFDTVAGDSEVLARRYDATGTAVGAEFQVNSFTSSYQLNPATTVLPDGGFVVVWQSMQQDGSNTGVYGQRFDADGTAVGGEFRINTYTTSSQELPAVATLDDGGFVVTWSSWGQDGSQYGVYAQRYDASGATVGTEFQVNTETASSQALSSIAALRDGGFLITWASEFQDGNSTGIFAQRYDSAGAPVGTEFQVNTYTLDGQYSPTVIALEAGGFIIAWASFGQDGSAWGLYAQRYDASGTPIGDEFRLSQNTAGSQFNNGVYGAEWLAQLNDGRIVAVWDSQSQTEEIFAHLLDLPFAGRVEEGGDYVLTAADMPWTDPDDAPADVTFTVTDLVNGFIEVNGVESDTFTGEDLANGDVVFVHDGSETTSASFKVGLEDGDEDNSPPSSQSFNFSVTPVNDAPQAILAGPTPDVVAAEPDSDGVAIALNLSGLLVPGGGEFTGAGPRHVVLADFNGDGRLDIATSDSLDGTVTVLLMDDCGCFFEASGSPVAVGGVPGSLVVGDINNDLIVDLVVVQTGTRNVSVLLGNGDGTFAVSTSQVYVSSAGSVLDVALGDFNNDGKVDLVAVGDDADYPVTIAYGNGSGGFTANSGFSFFQTDPLVDVKTGFIDGDGNVDFVMVNSTTGTVLVAFGGGPPNAVPSGLATLIAGDTPVDAVLGDVDGDGRLDIVVANSGDSTVSVFLNNGSRGFGAQTVFATEGVPASIALADMDGDGNLDIVVGGTLSDPGGDFGTFEILRGNGDGTFLPDPTPLTGSFPVTSIAVGNVDPVDEPTYPLLRAYTEGDVLALMPHMQVQDADSTMLQYAEVVILNGVTGDILDADTTGTSITLDWDADNFILSLIGVDTLAAYQQVLRSVTFTTGVDPTDELNGGGEVARLITVSMVDDEGPESELGYNGIVVQITPVDQDPTVALSATTVDEFAARGTVVGTLSVDDVDSLWPNASFVLLDSAGGRFSIVGNELRVADRLLLDYEQAQSYTVKVRFDLAPGVSLEETYVIAVNDINPEIVNGDSRGNIIVGGALGDTLRGADGDDTLTGNNGNDTLNGGAGADTMDGGADNDTFYVDDEGDIVLEAIGGGSDRVHVSAPRWVLDAGQEIERIDISIATGAEVTGNAFGQSIYGGAGADTLRGEDGDDKLDGRGGADQMHGGTGNDVFYVDDSGDLVFEAAGEGNNDRVIVNTSTWTLGAGQEIERISAGIVGVTLTGNELAQSIYGSSGVDTLSGEGGDDKLYGGRGADTLWGGEGRDWLDGGMQYDDMHGGAGDDTYIIGQTQDRVFEAGGDGQDRALVYVRNWTLNAGQEVETLTAKVTGAFISGNEFGQSIYGSSGDDGLRGEAGNDRLYGGGGDDRLYGGDGDDWLEGGAGINRLWGGADDDTYLIRSGKDEVFEAAGEGNDRVLVYVNQWRLGRDQEVERIDVRTASGAIVTGNNLGQRITGGDGADTITGGGGGDILYGGGGADTFLFRKASETANAQICDFSSAQGDRIDLSAIVTSAPDQALHFNAVASGLTGVAGELVAIQQSSTTYRVEGDLTGNGRVSFWFIVTTPTALADTDFIL